MKLPWNANTKSKTLLWLLVVLLVAATLLVNTVFSLLGKRVDMSVDLTANGAFRVEQGTVDMLRALDQDVHIYVLSTEDRFAGSAYFTQTLRILKQYEFYSPHVTLEFVDSAADPTFATRFPSLALDEGNVLVTGGGQVEQLRLSSLFNYTYNTAGELVVHSSRAEEALTGAILKLTASVEIRVALLTGNGVSEADAFVRLLQDNNYIVEPVPLATGSLEPYDVALLLAPQTDLSDEALHTLDDFLYNGGAYGKILFYTADVTQPQLPATEAFLREWGLEMGDGAVFETMENRTFGSQPYFLVADYADDELRSLLLDENTPVVLPLSRPMRTLFEVKDGVFTRTLLEFADTAGVRPGDAPESFRAADATTWGPLPALVLCSRVIYGDDGLPAHQSHVLVSASTYLLDAGYIQNTTVANSEMLLNTLNTLTERADVVIVQPKSLAGNALTITTAGVNRLGVVLVIVLPLGILAAGCALWLLRRYK